MHIPFFFLANTCFSKPGDTILDPFSGSGTVLLESILSGRQALGSDANPFARLLSKVKTTPIPSPVLKRATRSLLQRIKAAPEGKAPDVINLDYWFYPAVVKQLQCIYEAIEKTKNVSVRDFFSVCFSGCVRKVSLADPRVSVPVKLHSGKYPRRHPLRQKMDQHIEKLRSVSVLEVFTDIVTVNSRRLQVIHQLYDTECRAQIISDDARHMRFQFSTDALLGKDLADRSVHLIITSPPYPGAQKYIRSSCFSLGWLRMCKADDLLRYKFAAIGREEVRKKDWQCLPATGVKDAETLLERIYTMNPTRAAIASIYLSEMRDALREMYRVLRADGHLILVVANNSICNFKFRTVDYLRNIAEQTGFKILLTVVDDIHSRGLMTKRNRTANMISREWVLIFSK
jgi:DNA modification methylase